MELAKSTQEFLSSFAELCLSANFQENFIASLIVAYHFFRERQHTCIDDAYREIFSRSFTRDEKITSLLHNVLKGGLPCPISRQNG